MLNLLIGSDRVSVSDRMMQLLCDQAAEGREGLILIVPEQFSHGAERRLCEVGGDTVSRYAEVLSFSRMADRITAVHGGAARAYLDRGGRVLAMALAAEQAASRIKLYGSVLRKPEFLSELVQMAEEFQSYCLSPSALLDAAARAEGQFAQKLEELALLYESYLAVCANGMADPAEKLSVLGSLLMDTDWALSRSFWVDGFTDFTGAELAVLEALLLRGADLWIAVPAANVHASVSEPVRETLRAVTNLAQKHEIPVRRIQCEHKSARPVELETLLQKLFTSDHTEIPCEGNVCLLQFDSMEEECRHAVQQMRKLTSEGVRCRDISVVCTDLQAYGPPLRAALRMAELPHYFAGETDILSKPVLGAVMSALTAAVGMLDYQDVSLYLKSGLPCLAQDRCDRLDSYAYTWNLRGSQWTKPFVFHPQGFGVAWTQQDEEILAQLEQDRQTALSELLVLRREMQQAANTGEMVLAFDRYLTSIHLRQRLQEQAQLHADAGRGSLAQEISQLYEILCASLEQMYLILGSTVRTAEDFSRLYRLLLTQYRVGTIPAGLDQVHISSLPDLRYGSVKHLLVLGAADGSFPAYKTAEGLLSEEERRSLLSQGMTLAPCRADRMDREICSIYMALCAAQQTLRFSYAGEQPAWLFRRAASMLPHALHKPDETVVLNIPTYAAWRLRNGMAEPTDIPDLEQIEAAFRQLRDYEFAPLAENTVQGLYGRQINLSASRIDKYAACRFAFFLTYGLKAKPRRRAKLDPSVFGTLVHEVLEKTVLGAKELGGFRTVTEAQLLDMAVDALDAYVQEHFPEQAEREAYLFRRSREEILSIVRDLGEELRTSLFQPESCELHFAENGSLPPIAVQGERAMCRISGFVDRVDLYEADGTCYVRVVDYKTGRKSFDYTDILNGAGLQMLIYLFALRQYGGKLYHKGELEPAGVLYMPARREYLLEKENPDDKKAMEDHAKARRRNGLIRKDEFLLSAMEEDTQTPKYMPYKRTKNGLEGNLASREQMTMLERHVLRTLADMTDSIASGDVLPNPTDRGGYGPCSYCDYADVCHQDLCRHDVRVMASTSADLFWEKLEEEEARHG